AVGNYDPRDIDVNVAVTILVEVKDIRLNFANEKFQIAARFLDIALCDFHPFEAVLGGTIINIGEIAKPSGLIGARELAEADEGHAMAARGKTAHQLLRVCPDPA